MCSLVVYMRCQALLVFFCVRADRLCTMLKWIMKERKNDGLSFECPLPLHLDTKKAMKVGNDRTINIRKNDNSLVQ